MIIHGEALEELRKLADNSVDAIVTDPPYGLSFMGKKWDYDVPSVDVWREALRVLKPGGHLLAFAGTRTQHRMAVNIEDAGFEIRDMIAWVYGSGFPKSLNIGKQIDKINGQPRPTQEFKDFLREGKKRKGYTSEQIDSLLGFNSGVFSQHYVGNNKQIEYPTPEIYNRLKSILELDDSFDYLVNWAEAEREVIGKKESQMSGWNMDGSTKFVDRDITIAATDQAKQWEGWGTALKPAVEPVGVYAKPLQLECIFAILIENIWKNLFALGVVKDLNVIPAKLRKVVNSVPESVKINVLENIDVAKSVEKSFMRQEQQSTGKDTTKEGSALGGVKESGKKNTLERKTQTGEEAGVNLTDMSISVLKGDISENTALLWKNISEEIFAKMNTLTTSTAIKLITELKTLRLLLLQNTLRSTGNSTKTQQGVKPALEPITVARKKPEGTVAENCLKWGVGGLNIDGCRVGFDKENENFGKEVRDYGEKAGGQWQKGKQERSVPPTTGRFPANLIHSGEDEVVGLFPQSKAGKNKEEKGTGGIWNKGTNLPIGPEYGDNGSAARFFYCAKASKSERNKGLEGFEEKEIDNQFNSKKKLQPDGELHNNIHLPRANNHPTVKPLALMEYLVKLVSKEGHTVLDPFAGSGTTGMACKKLGREFIGIDLEEEYVKIAEARIKAIKVDKKLF